MKLVFLTLIFSLISSSWACQISGPKMVIFNKEKNNSKPSKAFTFTKCSPTQEVKLKGFINDFEGTLSYRAILAETGIKVKLESRTELAELNSFLNKRIEKDKEWRFISSNLTGQNDGIVKVSDEESLSLRCDQCSNTGTKNIKIEIYNALKSRYRYLWAQTDLAAKTTALYPVRSLPVNNTALTPSDFETKVVYHTRPEQFFTQANQLVFYKVNKPKSKGEPIKFQDLTPVNLVKMGQPTTVILRNGAIRLETTAISSQSGKLGQQIRLKNTKSKRTIIGKVVNFNKVEVEL